MEKMTVDTEKYLDFVAGVTSFPSSDLPALLAVSYTHLTLPTTPYV